MVLKALVGSVFGFYSVRGCVFQWLEFVNQPTRCCMISRSRQEFDRVSLCKVHNKPNENNNVYNIATFT